MALEPAGEGRGLRIIADKAYGEGVLLPAQQILDLQRVEALIAAAGDAGGVGGGVLGAHAELRQAADLPHGVVLAGVAEDHLAVATDVEAARVALVGEAVAVVVQAVTDLIAGADGADAGAPLAGGAGLHASDALTGVRAAGQGQGLIDSAVAVVVEVVADLLAGLALRRGAGDPRAVGITDREALGAALTEAESAGDAEAGLEVLVGEAVAVVIGVVAQLRLGIAGHDVAGRAAGVIAAHPARAEAGALAHLAGHAEHVALVHHAVAVVVEGVADLISGGAAWPVVADDLHRLHGADGLRGEGGLQGAAQGEPSERGQIRLEAQGVLTLGGQGGRRGEDHLEAAADDVGLHRLALAVLEHDQIAEIDVGHRAVEGHVDRGVEGHVLRPVAGAQAHQPESVGLGIGRDLIRLYGEGHHHRPAHRLPLEGGEAGLQGEGVAAPGPEGLERGELHLTALVEQGALEGDRALLVSVEQHDAAEERDGIDGLGEPQLDRGVRGRRLAVGGRERAVGEERQRRIRERQHAVALQIIRHVIAVGVVILSVDHPVQIGVQQLVGVVLWGGQGAVQAQAAEGQLYAVLIGEGGHAHPEHLLGGGAEAHALVGHPRGGAEAASGVEGQDEGRGVRLDQIGGGEAHRPEVGVLGEQVQVVGVAAVEGEDHHPLSVGVDLHRGQIDAVGDEADARHGVLKLRGDVPLGGEAGVGLVWLGVGAAVRITVRAAVELVSERRVQIQPRSPIRAGDGGAALSGVLRGPLITRCEERHEGDEP